MMKNNFKITNGNGGVVSGVHAVHGGAVVVGNHLGGASNSRCATLGRVKNLEMTEYQRQKFINGTDIPMVWYDIENKKQFDDLIMHYLPEWLNSTFFNRATTKEPA